MRRALHEKEEQRQRRQAALAALGLLLKLGAGAALGYAIATRGGEWVEGQGRRLNLLQRLGAGLESAVVGVFGRKKARKQAGGLRGKGQQAEEGSARRLPVPV